MGIYQNETTKLFVSLATFSYMCGLPAFWDTHVARSKGFIKIYGKFIFVMNVLLVFFTCSAEAALFTQKNLTKRQEYDRSSIAMLAPLLYMFNIPLWYYKAECRDIICHLAVVLREYNDRELEAEMTRKIRLFSTFFFFNGLVMVAVGGISAVYKVITEGEIFCPVIPAWPNPIDTSALSLLTRVILYISWWMFAIRVMAMLIIVVIMLVAISYQFKNLQSYFCSLEYIFRDESLNQAQKEKKYEKAFKLGIYMHSVILRVRNQHQDIMYWIFASEIIMTFIGLMLQLTAIMNGKNDVNTLSTTYSNLVAMLINLAFFMWNGGNITVEAAKVSEAMYFSGWENCSGQSSARVRKLVACAIRQAQEPIVYITLGVVEYSYDAYVKISKLPYTVVSMFY